MKTIGIVSTAVLALAVTACSQTSVPSAPPVPAAARSAFASRDANDFQTLHDFAGTPSDGSWPNALIFANGVLYGTTQDGGRFHTAENHAGVLFSVTASGTERILRNFGGDADESTPTSSGLAALHGSIYGGASFQAVKGGYFYRLGPSGNLDVLDTFAKTHATPSFLSTAADAIYGIGNGQWGEGAVYRLSPDGVLAILHGFNGGTGQGERPTGNPVVVNGTVYGTVQVGGAFHQGAVYAIEGGRERTICSFRSDDGAWPVGRLVQVGSTVYGTTSSGGTSPAVGDGTVFSFSTTGRLGCRTIFRFKEATTGGDPLGGLLFADGKLYGTTADGGAYKDGTVFSLTLGGKETTLHTFTGPDGDTPDNLVYANGRLYGDTWAGGSYGYGTIFSLKP